MNSVYETRKARQDFDGLGELFSFLFPESGSIYFFMLLGLVAAETIGEGEADDSAKVHVRSPVLFLTARSAVNDVVEGFELGGNDYLKKPFFLSFNKRIECLFEVFVEPLGWVIRNLMLARFLYVNGNNVAKIGSAINEKNVFKK